MKIVTTGTANASGDTEAHGSAADGGRPTAKAVAHASIATARAEAEILPSVTAAAKTNAVTAAAKAKTHAAVTGAAAEAKTHAVTTAATAPTAHRGVRRCRSRQREGKRRQGRQK
jgi:hypothetical protein